MMAKKAVESELPDGWENLKDLPSSEFVRKKFEIGITETLEQKLSEISQLIWIPAKSEAKDIKIRVARAIELYEGLAPGDGAEGMLAAQMVGTHMAALDCLRRAALSNQTFEGRDMALKQAEKLMALFQKQLIALDKHRGKGQQKVTVEHVHVEPGGQAIVGTVEAGRAGREVPSDGSPQMIENAPTIPVPEVRKRKAPAARSKITKGM